MIRRPLRGVLHSLVAPGIRKTHPERAASGCLPGGGSCLKLKDHQDPIWKLDLWHEVPEKIDIPKSWISKGVSLTIFWPTSSRLSSHIH